LRKEKKRKEKKRKEKKRKEKKKNHFMALESLTRKVSNLAVLIAISHIITSVF